MMSNSANGILSGEINVDYSVDRTYEVFYERPYARPPSLKVWQKGSSVCQVVEQRTDGFKIKGHDLYKIVNWEAKGEFANSIITHISPSPALPVSYSVFGVPNEKYTYDLFVVMPFAEKLKPVYDYLLKQVAKNLNLSIARADDFFSQNSIMREVWSAINHASIIIADCTGKNPNVFYEIGIAHAIGKPVILIAQNQDDVPSDLRHIRYIQYEYSKPGWVKLESAITKTIVEIIKDMGKGK